MHLHSLLVLVQYGHQQQQPQQQPPPPPPPQQQQLLLLLLLHQLAGLSLPARLYLNLT